MSDNNKAKMIKESRIGVELSDDQCATLAELIEVGDYDDGEVVVAEGAKDDHLIIHLLTTVFSVSLHPYRMIRTGRNRPKNTTGPALEPLIRHSGSTIRISRQSGHYSLRMESNRNHCMFDTWKSRD